MFTYLVGKLLQQCSDRIRRHLSQAAQRAKGEHVVQVIERGQRRLSARSAAQLVDEAQLTRGALTARGALATRFVGVIRNQLADGEHRALTRRERDNTARAEHATGGLERLYVELRVPH